MKELNTVEIQDVNGGFVLGGAGILAVALVGYALGYAAGSK